MAGRTKGRAPESKRAGALAKLVGLPRAEMFEAPSSWLTRAALSQGVRPTELLSFMGLRGGDLKAVDQDLLLTSANGVAALRTCEGVADMPIACKIFRALRSFDPNGRILLRDDRGRARSRYCAECLRCQRTPHFELHWRFATWRYCPVHSCLMEERCPRCRKGVCLPFDMAVGGRDRGGIAYLWDCGYCGAPLRSVEPVRLDALTITEFDQVRLSNGRALMAALYEGRVHIPSQGWVASSRSGKYVKMATFWKAGGWISPDDVRAGANGNASRGPASRSEPFDQPWRS